MIRGVKVINGTREETVEEVLKSIGAEVKSKDEEIRW